MVTIVAWLMCWYMSMSDHRTCTGASKASHPVVPVPPVRVMLRSWRAATDSVARSSSPLPYISVSVRWARLTRELFVVSHSGDLLLAGLIRLPTASTSKHRALMEP